MKNPRKFYLLYLFILFLPLINNSFSHADEITGKAWITQKDNINVIGIKVTITKGAYIYHTDLGDKNAIGTPLSISILPDKYEITGFSTSTPKTKQKPLFTAPSSFYKVNIHTDSMYIFLKINKKNPITTDSMLKPEPTSDITVKLNGQLCNKQHCLQFSLILPAKTANSSPEAIKVFSLMPDFNQFIIPLPAWSSYNTVQKTDSTAIPSTTCCTNIKNLNSSTGLLKTPETKPSLLEVMSSQIENTDPLSGLPKFQIHNTNENYSFISWLGIAVLAGFLLNFMPCVLPVLSLKVIGFVNQAHEDKKRLILLSLSYSGGIISVFFIIALAVAGFGMQWGEQFQSETFNIILACLIFAFALSFFGVFEFSSPVFAGKLQNEKKIPREGYLGAYFTGIIATLMATPCSGPFLGATISWALTQKAVIVFTVFLFIGFGMSLPYFLLSINNRLRNLLPKPGTWMLTFRTAMGFILMLTVTYLMVFIQTENLIATCILMVFIAFACWIYGKYAIIIYSKKIRWCARICSVIILVIGIYLSFGIFNSIILSSGIRSQTPHAVTYSAATSSDHQIIPFDFELFKQDLANGKNVLVDFTADWCPNCQYNTHYVFYSATVKDKLNKKQVKFYTADLTNNTPFTKKIRDFLKLLGGNAIPYACIFSSDAPDTPYILPDILSTAKVTSVLDKLPDPAKH